MYRNYKLTTATVQKRTPDVQIISAKQMARMIKRNIKRTAKDTVLENNNNNNNNNDNNTKFYISALREICPFPLDQLNGVQGWDDSIDLETKLKDIKTDFGEEYDNKIKNLLRKYE